jgi:acyl carrier protein
MNKFYAGVANVLELPEVSGTTCFRDVATWCSLHAFGLLVMMENDFSSPITLDEFMKKETVDDLFEVALLTLAAKIFNVEKSSLSLDTAYGSIKEWDSVNHLRLVMESEKKFGLSFPIEKIEQLKKLSDFIC